jgi:hypothetical protein
MGFEVLREIEGNDFLKENKIATPARVTSFNSQGGKEQPTLEKDWQNDTGVGKQASDRDPDIGAYGDNAYNVS